MIGSHHGRSTLLVTLALVAATSAVVPPAPVSAAPTDVVISELMYHASSDLDGDDFLELTNLGPTPVDLSGWSFAGITLTFPAGTTIGAGARLVVARDAVQFQARYGFAPAAVYSGNLSNSGEKVTLRDAAVATIDTVTYGEAAPWPTTTDGGGPSLELIDPSLDNDDFLNWAASTAPAGHTAGAANSVAGAGLGPRITAMTATPHVPAANQAVVVTATITGLTGATLLYRRDFAAEQSVPMTLTTGDTYTATIPGVAAGHLIRYRIAATNAARTSRVPRADDTVLYEGVAAAAGLSSAIPVFEWFIADADYTAITANPTADIERSAVLAYNGTVIDNVTVNIRGASSQTAPKPSWQFVMPSGHDLDMPGILVEPVDEFAMQADFSDKSHGRSVLSWEAYRIADVANAQTFPVRTQKNGQFLGEYLYLDLFDGTWREREGYDTFQFFKASRGAYDEARTLEDNRWEKKNPDDGDYAPLRAVLDGLLLSGTAERDFMLANADIPQMINYAAVTAITYHTDSSSKNYYFAQDPATGRWSVVPWDLDHTWGNTCCDVVSTMVTPAEAGDKSSSMMKALLAVPEWRTMYFRRLRTLVDEILAPGLLEGVYDTRLSPGQPEHELDRVAWGQSTSTAFANQRTALFNALNTRRSVFANDSRVPTAQPAAPNIVINEIQHSPSTGDDAEFIELSNPMSVAIDVWGWSVSGATAFTIPPGAVLVPGGRMVFVRNDPTFRGTYGPTVFVGGTYASALPASGTLQLVRPDGSVSDAVTYGGPGWPQASGGPSLELINPNGSHDDPASWALSLAPGGSPGAANGTAVVIVAPGAPTIGTATRGDASATVRWTAPANNGGSPITGYDVRVVNSATSAQVGALRPAPAGATSLVVTGLTNGTAYRFQVSARNVAGSGPFSVLSSAITPATVPGAPVIGTATRGAAGGTITATANWSPPSTTGGSPITGYRVTALRMSSSSASATVVSSTVSPVLASTARSRSFTLVAGNYRFTVVAINAVGTSAASARSNNVVPR